LVATAAGSSVFSNLVVPGFGTEGFAGGVFGLSFGLLPGLVEAEPELPAAPDFPEGEPCLLGPWKAKAWVGRKTKAKRGNTRKFFTKPPKPDENGEPTSANVKKHSSDSIVLENYQTSWFGIPIDCRQSASNRYNPSLWNVRECSFL
jgi:hypothetical protein